ncbi:acyltransferase family protein [Geodermatophilus marinus]|uniref:acyltransferase family protein n=1 Tax=Geodermatophilus sp. LHW52908 TaxID=2303986 RepID=UPI001314409F|nr:acyltransferase [Geodermatophilus sp. LHW52908]
MAASHGGQQVDDVVAPAGAVAPPRTKPAFRTDVEGLRAVAIGAVLLFHAGVPRISGGGFVGVDVFFVISGFLITGLLVREVDRTGRIALADFYARRARRILPAAAFVTVVTLVAGSLLLDGPEQSDLGWGGFWAALQSANWYWASISIDELVPRLTENPLLHYWSLAVEEQFYLVWPLTIILVVAVVRRRSGSWRPALLATLGVLSAASLLACVLVTYDHRLLAYFGSPMRAWQFGAGALLAIGAATVDRWAATERGRRLGVGLGWAGMALILSCLLWANGTPYPGVAAIVPTVGAAAVILAGGLTARRGSVAAVLSWAPVRFVGRISYSWYLWHLPATFVAEHAFGLTGWYWWLLVELIAGGLAYLTMVLVERPFRYAPAFSATPGRGLALGGAVTALTVAVALAVVATS